jgi:hypothetical protein
MLIFDAENCFQENRHFSAKIGRNCRKLVEIAENWSKLPKIGPNCRKLVKNRRK